MKKLRYIFPLLAILLLGFTSCSNDRELMSPDASLDYPVSFTLDNGGATTRRSPNQIGYTTVALSREKVISSLYAVIFNFSDDSFYKTIELPVHSDSDTYQFDMCKGGDFTLLLVANADDALISELTNFTASSTVSDLTAIVSAKEPGEDATATNFLMTSELTYNVSVAFNSTTDLGTLKLIRLAARFDFYNQVDGLEMTNLTFSKRAVSSYLVEPTDQGVMAFTTDKVYDSTNGLCSIYSIGAVYSYEDATKGDCSFTLEAFYHGRAINLQTITFPDLAIKRNHLYNIIITEDPSAVTPNPEDPTDLNGHLNFAIEVADWNDAETLSLTGDDLLGKGTPTFAVSGTDVVTTPATESASAIVTVPEAETTVSITATSASSMDSKLTYSGELPSGWSIESTTADDISSVNGQLTHTFTILINENTTTNPRSCEFALANVLDPSAKVVFTLTQKKSIFNPLKCVAEYNLASAGVFATEQSTATDKNGWFNYADGITGNIAPAGYHVPDADEFIGALGCPYMLETQSNQYVFSFTLYGQTIPTSKSDSKKINDNLAYALCFKDYDNENISEYTCAYRYVFTEGSTEDKNGLTVTSRHLGTAFSGDINTISEQSFWDTNTSEDVSRFFPSCGMKSDTGSVTLVGTEGYYWSTSPVGIAPYTWAEFLQFKLSSAGMGHDSMLARYSVRVFKD